MTLTPTPIINTSPVEDKRYSPAELLFTLGHRVASYEQHVADLTTKAEKDPATAPELAAAKGEFSFFSQVSMALVSAADEQGTSYSETDDALHEMSTQVLHLQDLIMQLVPNKEPASTHPAHEVKK